MSAFVNWFQIWILLSIWIWWDWWICYCL